MDGKLKRDNDVERDPGQDYKVGANVESSTVYVYDGSYRWGYVDADCDAVKGH